LFRFFLLSPYRVLVDGNEAFFSIAAGDAESREDHVPYLARSGVITNVGAFNLIMDIRPV
jgi:hypothetical protein